MDKTIIAFLRKEPMATKTSNTDGYKLFFQDTCMGQWKEHHVLINNTKYDDRNMNNFILLLQKWIKKSDIIYRICSKAVPVDTKELKSYE